MFGTPGTDPYDVGRTLPAPRDDERMWAALAHGGSFIAAWVALGVLAPLAVLLLKGSSSAFVRRHAIESLNFQLNALFWIAVALVLTLVLIGLPLLIIIGIWYLFIVILATVRASSGRPFRYPLTLRLLR